MSDPIFLFSRNVTKMTITMKYAVMNSEIFKILRFERQDQWPGKIKNASQPKIRDCLFACSNLM